MRSIVLHRPPHRSNDGVATAAGHRISNSLPQRAIGPSLKLPKLLAVIGDIVKEARSDHGRARSGGLFGRSVEWPQKSPVKASIMSSKVRRRGGYIQRPLGGQGALQTKLGSEAKMSEPVSSQGRERGGSMLNSETSGPDAPKNALLALELRLNPLESAPTVSHAAKSIAVGIAPYSTLRGEGGAVQEGDQLDNRCSARAERLSRLLGASTPRTRAQLL